MTGTTRNWDSFALLLIDVQKDFWTDEMTAAFPNFHSNVTALLDNCRKENLEVVHLRAKFRADKSDWMLRYRLLDRIPCVEGTKGAEIFPCAAHISGEKIVYKQSFDGFHNPELQNYLGERNKRFLLIAGLVTSVCVLLTAAAAAQKGYLVAVVDDCCGDAPASHQHVLDRYPFIFSTTSVDKISQSRESWLTELNDVKSVR